MASQQYLMVRRFGRVVAKALESKSLGLLCAASLSQFFIGIMGIIMIATSLDRRIVKHERNSTHEERGKMVVCSQYLLAMTAVPTIVNLESFLHNRLTPEGSENEV